MIQFVLFGITGDLSRRLILPAMVRLFAQGKLPELTILGFGTRDWSDEQLRQHVAELLRTLPGVPLEAWERFQERIHYQAAELSAEGLQGLKQLSGDAVFYLALPPDLFAQAAQALGTLGVADERSGFRRLAVEKPFGTDLASAQALNQALHAFWREDQIFRMDHFLGKAATQNLLHVRLANRFLEPIWNGYHVDFVQITYAETLGLEGRARYYDRSGALRDMLQNHLLQLFALVAMEPPARLDAQSLRIHKLEALRAVRPIPPGNVDQFAARGQYVGYRNEPGIPADSRTETFAAMKLYVDSWRWQGIPFYLRSGKRLAADAAEIALVFRPAPAAPLGTLPPGRLVFRMKPGALELWLSTRDGDEAQQLRLQAALGQEPEYGAYEELLLALLDGDLSFFPSEGEVEEAWRIVDPILRAWQQGEPEPYEQGSEGPKSQHALLDPGDSWDPIGK